MSRFRHKLPHPRLDDILDALESYDAFRPIGQPMVQQQLSFGMSQRFTEALRGTTKQQSNSLFVESDDL